MEKNNKIMSMKRIKLHEHNEEILREIRKTVANDI